MRQVRIQIRDGGQLGFFYVTSITIDEKEIRIVESFDWGYKVATIKRENVITIQCDL